MSGFVSIVGAGPWDPELLTLAGRDRLARADTVIADYLANPALLQHCRPGVTVHQRQAGPRSGARIDQDRIHELLLEHAGRGEHVVRLKGGDPFLFGRGAEEAQVLRAAGIPFEIVPGVPSAIAAAAAAGIPVTHRDHTPAVTFVSGFEAYDKAGLHVAWEHLARSAGTLVFLMGVRNLRENMARLVEAGRAPDTPAAAVRWGTRGVQRTVVGTVGSLPDMVDRLGLRAPALVVVGDVVNLRREIAWFESRPLFGRRVLVARAGDRGAHLVRRLAAAGADAVAFPCLAFAPPDAPEDRARLAALPDLLAPADGLIVSSPTGAGAALDALDAAGHDARRLAGKIVAAIGSGTARALRARGLRPDLVPARARAEGLIDALAERDLLGRGWVHVRADEGRGLLGEAIRGAGGSYELVIGYRTLRPPVPPLLIRSLRPPAEGGEGLDAVILASGKATRHLLASMADVLGEASAREILARARVVCLGPVTADAARAAGLAIHAVADTPTDDAILTSLHAALAPR